MMRPAITVAAIGLGAAMLAACGSEAKQAAGVSPQRMADALYTVMASDRAAYTRLVVDRLAMEEKVIAASEHWQDDRALPLPAQMFRYGAELTAESNAGLSYSLQSLWPVNKQNAPRTDAEKEGLQYVIDNPDQSYYAEETLGGKKYFTAVYPDKAIAPACVSCHNDHQDSPRNDFKEGDVMGGVVIRISLEG